MSLRSTTTISNRKVAPPPFEEDPLYLLELLRLLDEGDAALELIKDFLLDSNAVAEFRDVLVAMHGARSGQQSEPLSEPDEGVLSDTLRDRIKSIARNGLVEADRPILRQILMDDNALLVLHSYIISSTSKFWCRESRRLWSEPREQQAVPCLDSEDEIEDDELTASESTAKIALPWKHIQKAWERASVPAFVILPCILLLVVAMSYDRSLGFVSLVPDLRWTLLKTSVVGFAVTSLGALLLGHYGLLERIRLCVLGAGVAFTGGLVGADAVIGVYADSVLIEREELFQDHRWILYDSVFFWPEGNNVEKLTERPGQQPNAEQIRHELQTLRSAGFDGIYVYGNPRLELLRIAKEMKFAVVQGIGVSDPGDFTAGVTQREVAAAIAAKDYVDAFVLGNMRARDVNMNQLQNNLANLRRETGKPVTPNFLQTDLSGERGKRLLRLSDFVVSDLPRPYEPDAGDPQVAVNKVKEGIQEFRSSDLPALLMFCGYPSAGGEGFSMEAQAAFVRGVVRIDMPRGVNVVFSTSFDLPWKEKMSEAKDSTTPLSDAKLGFFEPRLSDDGSSVEFTAKPAVGAFPKR